jgi:hypothetical protein
MNRHLAAGAGVLRRMDTAEQDAVTDAAAGVVFGVMARMGRAQGGSDSPRAVSPGPSRAGGSRAAGARELARQGRSDSPRAVSPEPSRAGGSIAAGALAEARPGRGEPAGNRRGGGSAARVSSARGRAAAGGSGGAAAPPAAARGSGRGRGGGRARGRRAGGPAVAPAQVRVFEVDPEKAVQKSGERTAIMTELGMQWAKSAAEADFVLANQTMDGMGAPHSTLNLFEAVVLRKTLVTDAWLTECEKRGAVVPNAECADFFPTAGTLHTVPMQQVKATMTNPDATVFRDVDLYPYQTGLTKQALDRVRVIWESAGGKWCTTAAQVQDGCLILTEDVATFESPARIGTTLTSAINLEQVWQCILGNALPTSIANFVAETQDEAPQSTQPDGGQK